MENFAQKRFEQAQVLIWQAGESLRQAQLEQVTITEKSGHQDLVTRWDQQTEQFLRRSILVAFPDDAIIGEEYPTTGGEKATDYAHLADCKEYPTSNEYLSYSKHLILGAKHLDANKHTTAGERPAAGKYSAANGNSAASAAADSCTWYIDPIDGTTNFINQHRHYAISIGCYQADKPLFGLVLDVARQALYWARSGEGAFCNETLLHTSQRQQIPQLLLNTPGVLYTFLKPHPCQAGMLRLAQDVRGVRSLGSVALELCAVAAGESDLMVALRSSPWDHNAARIILSQAGGSICALNGQPLPVDNASPLLAANSQAMLHQIWCEYCQAE